MVIVTCPACSTTDCVPEWIIGRGARCITCNKIITLPMVEKTKVDLDETPLKIECSSCGNWFEIGNECSTLCVRCQDTAPKTRRVPSHELMAEKADTELGEYEKRPLPSRRVPSPNLAIAEKTVRIAVFILGSFIGVILILALISEIPSKTHDSSNSHVSDSKPPLVDAGEKAKQSFETLENNFRNKFVELKPERMPPEIEDHIGLGTGVSMAVEAELRVPDFFSLTVDVETTSSLVTPYRGTIGVDMGIYGTMKGAYRDTQFPFEFSFPYHTKERVEAVYLFRDGRWSLTEVKFTTTKFSTDTPEGKDSFMSQVLSMDVSRSNKVVGRVVKPSIRSDITLIRLLREAK